MKRAIVLGFSFVCLSYAVAPAFAIDYPLETCGQDSVVKKFSFAHQGSMMDDDAILEFTNDGGFTLYDEEDVNHIWTLDAGAMTLTRRSLTRGSRTYVNYSFESIPRLSSGGTGYTDWTNGMAEILHDLVHMETTLTERDTPLSQVKVALKCAQSILVNAVARGQARLLEGKTR